MNTKQAENLAEYAEGAKFNVGVPTDSAAARPYHQQYGKELVNSALWGLGLGAGGTALYHLINGAGSSQLSELKGLLHNPAPAEPAQKKQKGGKRKQTAKKQDASRLPESMQLPKDLKMPSFKLAAAASAGGLMANFQESLSKNLIPTQFVPSALWPTFDPNAPPSLNMAQHGWRQAANIIAAMGGGYGGMQLVNSMSADKRKKDIEDEVDTARRAYFSALTGKEAAALDDVYNCVKKTAEENTWSNLLPRMEQGLGLSKPGGSGALENAGIAAARTAQETGNNAWTAALLTALGTGALGAKYMYDQTKTRTQSENLIRARNSKARLQMLNQTPYIDPDELAALTGR